MRKYFTFEIISSFVLIFAFAGILAMITYLGVVWLNSWTFAVLVNIAVIYIIAYHTSKNE